MSTVVSLFYRLKNRKATKLSQGLGSLSNLAKVTVPQGDGLGSVDQGTIVFIYVVGFPQVPQPQGVFIR